VASLPLSTHTHPAPAPLCPPASYQASSSPPTAQEQVKEDDGLEAKPKRRGKVMSDYEKWEIAQLIKSGGWVLRGLLVLLWGLPLVQAAAQLFPAEQLRHAAASGPPRAVGGRGPPPPPPPALCRSVPAVVSRVIPMLALHAFHLSQACWTPASTPAGTRRRAALWPTSMRRCALRLCVGVGACSFGMRERCI
jgi:hypothetical protein